MLLGGPNPRLEVSTTLFWRGVGGLKLELKDKEAGYQKKKLNLPIQKRYLSHMCKIIHVFRYGAVNNKLIFLFMIFINICCGYSKQQSRWDGSFENPKHMLILMDRITIFKAKMVYISFKCLLNSLLYTECCLLITFANKLDPDQTRQNVGPDPDPNCLTLWWYFWKNFWKKLILKKLADDKKACNYPAC